MFLINWIYALVNITVFLLIFLYTSLASPGLHPGLAVSFSFVGWIKETGSSLCKCRYLFCYICWWKQFYLLAGLDLNAGLLMHGLRHWLESHSFAFWLFTSYYDVITWYHLWHHFVYLINRRCISLSDQCLNRNRLNGLLCWRSRQMQGVWFARRRWNLQSSVLLRSLFGFQEQGKTPGAVHHYSGCKFKRISDIHSFNQG